MKTDDVNRLIDQRQALAHKALDEMVAENQRLGLYDDAANTTEVTTEVKWVGLTKDGVDSWKLPDSPTVFEFAQFIENKLKEKNCG